MPITTLATANDILNRVAAEVGVEPVTDPYSSNDPTFVKLRYLLNIAGEELVEAYPWEHLQSEHQIVTDAATNPTAEYALPADFSRMINQTGWERSQRVPLGGPLSPQDWAYLKGRQLASNTLYASFRISEGLFKIYPSPPPDGLDINFEYIRNTWVRSGTEPFDYFTEATDGSQTILFHRTLISRYLKVKFLEATGFDTTKAQDDFTQIFTFLTGTDKGAPVLNAGGRRTYPYLGIGNVPDTGFGL